jgi:hypothetical protein
VTIVKYSRQHIVILAFDKAKNLLKQQQQQQQQQQSNLQTDDIIPSYTCTYII